MVATRSPRARRVVVTALGTGASALALSPLAHADTLTDTLAETIDGATAAIDNAAGAVTNTDAPAPLPSPVESLSTFAQQTFGVVPSNLLRTDSAGTTGQFEQPVTQTPALDQGVVTAAIDNYNTKVEMAQELAAPIQQIAQGFIDTHDGRLDDNTIAQAFGAAQVPTAETINAIAGDINTLAERALSGAVFADMQQAFDETLNTADFTPDLAGYIEPALEIARDVAGALAAVPRDVLRAAIESSPALLIEPLAAAAGTLIGIPLGTLTGAGLGKLAGSLLGIPLGAIPGAIIGSLSGAALTALPGLIGSVLLTVPLALALPLLSGATASTIALVAWATLVFTPWLIFAALTIPVAIFNGVALAVITVIAATFLAGFNPFAVPFYATILFSLVLPAGFALTILGAWILTILIPVTIYALGVLPIALSSFGTGYLAGLIPALLVPLIAIPFITTLSAIPGALLGLLPGALTGGALGSMLGSLIGIILGALTGPLAGQFLGRQIGRLVGIPAALSAFAALTALNFGNRTGDRVADPNGPYAGIANALDEMWRNSSLGRFFGALEHNFFNNTETGHAYGDLVTRVNNLFKQIAFLDGRRLREMLLRGGLLGAVLGVIPGALTGGLLGTFVGALNPLNLVNGLLFGAPWFITGALLGAGAGSALSRALSLLPALLSIPLTFPIHYAALALPLALLGIPLLLGALAVTVIPPLAIAVSTSTLAWLLTQGLFFALPVFLVTAFFTLVSIFNTNPITIAIIGALLSVPFGPLAFFIAPFIAAVTGAIAAILAIINIANGTIAAFMIGAIVGIPVFWLALPFFVFPALAMAFALTVAAFLLIPAALGMSILDAIKVHFASSLLLDLVNVPLGALIGGLLSAIPATVLGTLVSSIVRAVTYGLAGTGIGAAVGATLGFPAGALAALLTHTRVVAGVDRADAPTAWLDARILNQGGFGDSLSFIPNLSGNKNMTQLGGMMRVPTVAEPRMGFGLNKNQNRKVVNATALVGV